jgi:hypothetical protein
MPDGPDGKTTARKRLHLVSIGKIASQSRVNVGENARIRLILVRKLTYLIYLGIKIGVSPLFGCVFGLISSNWGSSTRSPFSGSA